MATYSTTLTYCTESDVEDHGGWSRGDIAGFVHPNEQQVYAFAQDTAAAIVGATEKWGNRIIPPSSTAPDDFINRLLIAANATGAAMLARNAIYLRSGIDRDKDAWLDLARKYEAIMGEGASSGGVVGGSGTGGSLQGAISAQADVGVIASYATQDGNTFDTGFDGRTDIIPAHFETDPD